MILESCVSMYSIFLFFELPRYAIGFLAIIWAMIINKNHEKPIMNNVITTPVSVIISTHNDAAAIETTIASLREQIGVALQIIVVNDGSTDDTDSKCRELARLGHIDQYLPVLARGGKASALNLGLQYAKHDFILSTDADTTFNRHALIRALAYFKDPKVGGVSGNLRVRNRDVSLATRVQSLDYLFSITMGRIINDVFKLYFVVSGAFGVFRKSVLQQVGAWHCGPGDDSDLCVRIHLAGFSTRFAPFALAMTSVPINFTRLARQRLRWNRSVIRVRFRKYRFAAHNPLHKNFNPLLSISFLNVYYLNAIQPVSMYCYILLLFNQYGSHALFILAGVHFLYMLLGMIKLMLALPLSEYPLQDAKLILFVPLYSIINTILLKTISLYATVNELTFTGSYEDSFVPKKVRILLKRMSG